MVNDLDINDIGYNAYTVAAMAKAAFSLLHEHQGSEVDDELVSVKLCLRVIIEKSTSIGDIISEAI
jgi:hypothetical protein